MDSLIQVLAQALDMVEIAFIGVTTNHGKRIAVLSAVIAKQLGWTEDQISDLVSCALLHDNALTEFILLHHLHGREKDIPNFLEHCVIGQRNAEILPFHGSIAGYILYHHERPDGQGPFRLREGEYPLGGDIISAADMMDAEGPFEGMDKGGLEALRRSVEEGIHGSYTEGVGQAILSVLDMDLIESLQNSRIGETVQRHIPVWNMDIEDPAIIRFAELTSKIIDYKSKTTGVHTQQIANRSWLMADHYGYGRSEKHQLYLAAALHDIGKLAIPPEVLEKPGKLTHDEFEIIKTHIIETRNILSSVEDLGPLIEWAANHHEKLDGSGYHLKKRAEDLDFNSRLMACLDIYQAASELRPYHPRRNHQEVMDILQAMVKVGAIDGAIVKDIDQVMAPWSGKDIEPPTLL